MEYSIQELSHLSGVTTRTLRWYDQIGLLKPSRVAESGYRYYGGAEVDRLQDILYYRALGVELARIKEYLDAPSFDRLAALRNHLVALEAERERLEQLIRSVKDTIGAEERNEIMSDEQKFEAFKQRAIAQNEKVYGAMTRRAHCDGPAVHLLLRQAPARLRPLPAGRGYLLGKMKHRRGPRRSPGASLTPPLCPAF